MSGAPPVPAHLVVGALGVGKTTTLLAAFAHRPPDERWAVVVNEFGRVGIDGPVLAELGGGVEVREIAGGCVCCVAGPTLRVALVRILRELRADRLFLEPSGLAHPAAIVDLLRSPGLREAVAPRAVIGLVDPARLGAGDRLQRELEEDLLAVSDVLVANRADLADEAALARFRALADARWPPFLRVVETDHGRLPAELLDLVPAPEAASRTPRTALRILAPHPDVHEHGFVWPPDRVFPFAPLIALLQTWARPGDPRVPAGLLRAKGLVRTDRGWLLVQAEPDRVHAEPVGWRRDSRFELLSPAAADWDAVADSFSRLSRGERAGTLV